MAERDKGEPSDSRIVKLRTVKSQFESLPQTDDLSVRRLRLVQTGIFDVAEEILRSNSEAFIFPPIENEANLSIGFLNSWVDADFGQKAGRINCYKYCYVGMWPSNEVHVDAIVGATVLLGSDQKKSAHLTARTQVLSEEQWKDRHLFEDTFWHVARAIGVMKEGLAISSVPISQPKKLEQAVASTSTTAEHEAMRKIFSVENPNIDFGQIGGQAAAVQEAKILANQIKNPEIFKQWGVEPPKGILFYGDPGGGKTLIAKAIASQADAVFLYATAADLLSHWQGESAQLARNLFEFAREEAKMSGKHCIIFLDDIDHIIPKRGAGFNRSTEAATLVLGTFLEQIDGIRELGPITVIAATNRRDMLDEAFLSRINRQIYVPKPDEAAIIEIFKIHLANASKKAGRQLVSDDIDLARIAKEKVGLSGRDIAQAVDATLIAKANSVLDGEEPSLVTEDDLLSAIEESGKLRIESSE